VLETAVYLATVGMGKQQGMVSEAMRRRAARQQRKKDKEWAFFVHLQQIARP
jgi:hypothetical protein